MIWPKEEEIIAAIHIKENILDSEIRDGYSLQEPSPNSRKQRYACGQYALSFRFKENYGNDEYCYRIWKKAPDPDVLKRYETITDYLRNLQNQSRKSVYFVDFEYKKEALKISNGVVLPGVKMKWVTGKKLSQYIVDNLNDTRKLKNLAESFLNMCRAFKCDMHFSHGDLSCSNIMITGRDKIKLIDYDSLYFQDMGACKQTTCGAANYQHPGRLSSKKSSSVDDDNFSQQVIYLSILVAIHRPDKIDYPVVEDELLFTNADYIPENFKESNGYSLVSSINDKEVQGRLRELEKAINGKWTEVRSICDFDITKGFSNQKDDFTTRQNTIQGKKTTKGRKYKTCTWKFCAYCGVQFAHDDDMFCGNCGKERGKMKIN